MKRQYSANEQQLSNNPPKRGTIKNIRIDLLEAMSGNLILVKAVAMAIFVKNRLRDPRIKDYTPNRLRDIIKHYQSPPHHNTVRKYVDELLRMELAYMDGRDLIFCSLNDRRGRYNLSLKDTSALTIAELENLLLAAKVVLIVKRKEFVKRTIEAAYNPKISKGGREEFKKARQTSRKYGYGNAFNDYGLSYKKIAKKLGICLQKAEEVIRFAIEHGLLVKEKRQEQVFVFGIQCAEKFLDSTYGGSFATKNNVYKVLANIYTIPIT